MPKKTNSRRSGFQDKTHPFDKAAKRIAAFSFYIFLFFTLLWPYASSAAMTPYCVGRCTINLEVTNSYYGFTKHEVNAAVRSALACRNQREIFVTDNTKQAPLSLRVYVSRSPPPQIQGYISMTLYYHGNIVKSEWASLSPFALAGPVWLANDIQLLARKLWIHAHLDECLT